MPAFLASAKPCGISGPPRAIVTIAPTCWVTNDSAQFSIVVTTPLPLQTLTVQPSGAAAALSCAIQIARFSEDEVLGITPMVSGLGVSFPPELELAAELADVVALLEALEPPALLELLLLPHAASPMATRANAARARNLLKLGTG